MNYITYEKDIAQSKSFYETFNIVRQEFPHLYRWRDELASKLNIV